MNLLRLQWPTMWSPHSAEQDWEFSIKKNIEKTLDFSPPSKLSFWEVLGYRAGSDLLGMEKNEEKNSYCETCLGGGKEKSNSAKSKSAGFCCIVCSPFISLLKQKHPGNMCSNINKNVQTISCPEQVSKRLEDSIYISNSEARKGQDWASIIQTYCNNMCLQ